MYKLYAIERVAGKSPSYEGPLCMVFTRIIFFRKIYMPYYEKYAYAYPQIRRRSICLRLYLLLLGYALDLY
jgi:hypothetical protein